MVGQKQQLDVGGDIRADVSILFLMDGGPEAKAIRGDNASIGSFQSFS